MSEFYQTLRTFFSRIYQESFLYHLGTLNPSKDLSSEEPQLDFRPLTRAEIDALSKEEKATYLIATAEADRIFSRL